MRKKGWFEISTAVRGIQGISTQKKEKIRERGKKRDVHLYQPKKEVSNVC